MKRFASGRRWFVPEVVQSSGMDCGPAALKCLLEGYGISANYGRLREACQTDVDGTSIDTMETVAVQLGLGAEQIMVPMDHVFVASANTLPALAVVRLPNGNTHFVVIWRKLGQFIQVMDPATGRRWSTCANLLAELYRHSQLVPAVAWRAWAGTAEFIQPLSERLAQLGVTQATRTCLTTDALADASWLSLAALDAATRMLTAIVQGQGLRTRQEITRTLTYLYETARQQPSAQPIAPIPSIYWSVSAGPSSGADEEPHLNLKGAVLVRVARSQDSAKTAPTDNTAAEATTRALSPELLAALEEPPVRPILEILHIIRTDGMLAPFTLMSALLLAALGVVGEALLLRSLIEIGDTLLVLEQRILLFSAIALFLLVGLLVELVATNTMLRIGRRLEVGLRMAFLAKIPRLGDRYFQSRLVSDMAERSHSVHRLRQLPWLAGHLLRALFTLFLTMLGMLWLDPASAPLTLLAGGFAVGLPWLAYPLMAERDLRVRSHLGALSRFYLDALLGLTPIRVHNAERAVRREHESLVVEWAHATASFFNSAVWVEGMQALVGFGLTAWLFLAYTQRHVDALGSGLLLIYWALNLPVVGQEIVQLLRQYPSLRNTVLRLVEPLGAPEPTEILPVIQTAATADLLAETRAVEPQTQGVTIQIQEVSVRLAGHTILQAIDLQIAAGQHWAIVGSSGAGKSTLVGLLLGWHRPATGMVLVDHEILDEWQIARLRRTTAWVDPAVQLWNRSFLDNVYYGSSGDRPEALATIIDAADLRAVLETLPDGMQSALGESGSLVSGGEGQRVRLGRAMAREQVRLVILDEPFRGLDRQKRRNLLARARTLWQHATLLCITHDIDETLAFDRVAVVAGGQIVEQGEPSMLATAPGSHYQALLAADSAVRGELWTDRLWRKLRLVAGHLEEESVHH